MAETFRVSQRIGWRNQSWRRQGGYCGGRSERRGLLGRRERKKGDFDPLYANGILTKGSSPSRFAVSLSSYVWLMMRDATMPDVCASSSAAVRWNVCDMYICICTCLLAHSHSTRCNLAMCVFTNTFWMFR